MKIEAIDFVFVAYICALVLVDAHNGAELGFSADVLASLSGFFFLALLWIGRLSVATVADLRRFLVAFTWPAIPIALLGVGQALLPSLFRFVTTVAPSVALDSRLDSGALVRATGFTGHWTGHGYYLIVCLAALCAVILLDRNAGKTNRYPILAVVAVVAGIFATVTLATIALAVVLLFVLMALVGVRPAVAVGAALGAIGMLIVFGEVFFQRITDQGVRQARLPDFPEWVPNTISYRILIWRNETVPAIADRPGTGWGTNLYAFDGGARVYPVGLSWPSAESQWMLTSITYGIPVAILLATVLYLALRRMQLSRDARPPGVSAIMITLLVSALFASALSPVFTNHGFPAAFWAVLGAFMGVQQRPSRAKELQVDVPSFPDVHRRS